MWSLPEFVPLWPSPGHLSLLVRRLTGTPARHLTIYTTPPPSLTGAPALFLPRNRRRRNFINSFREDHPEWTSLPGLFLRPGSLSLGAGKAYHPTVPPRYDEGRSWSPAALPFDNPCFNTAATANRSCHVKLATAATAGLRRPGSVVESSERLGPKCDGGLPCVFCPVDIAGQLGEVNVTVANEFCELDAAEDDKTVQKSVALLRLAARQRAAGTLRQFYLAVGMHKPCVVPRMRCRLHVGATPSARR